MYYLRRYRIIIILLAILHLLFTQIAVARYACPQLNNKNVAIHINAPSGMPCSEPANWLMDKEQPNLCYSFCQNAPQSADTTDKPTVLESGEFFLTDWQTYELPLLGSAGHGPWLYHATSPPLTIYNCCFRI